MRKYNRFVAAIAAALLLCGCSEKDTTAPDINTDTASAGTTAEHTIIWETEETVSEATSETEISSELLSSEITTTTETSTVTTETATEQSSVITSGVTLPVTTTVTTISDVPRETITETSEITKISTVTAVPETTESETITSVTSAETKPVTVTSVVSESTVENTVSAEPPSTSMTISSEKIPKSSDDFTGDESIVTVPIETELVTEGTYPQPRELLDVDYSEYFSESLFVGDSICSGLKIYNGLLKTENVAARINVSTWGLHKYTFQYKTNSADELDAHSIVELYQPKDIYIWMGMNDLYVVSKEKYAKNMCDLAQEFLKLSNESRIHIVSISPMCSWHNWNVELDGNNVVNEFNAYCEEYCSTKPYIDYINIHDALLNKYGALDDNNTGGEGIHLSASAYKIVLDEIIRSNEKID